MKSKKNWAALAAVILLVAGAALWLPKLLDHEPAPSMGYTLLDGRTAHTDDWRGKVVLVNFWATSCVTCVKEMPALVATHQKYNAHGYDTVAVAMAYDRPAYVANFASSRQLPFQVVLDASGEIARRFGDVQLTPTTYLINKRGEIVKRYVGEPDFAELDRLIEKLLAEAA